MHEHNMTCMSSSERITCPGRLPERGGLTCRASGPRTVTLGGPRPAGRDGLVVTLAHRPVGVNGERRADGVHTALVRPEATHSAAH